MRNISTVLGVVTLTLLPAPAPALSAAGVDIQFGVKVPRRDGVRLNATVYRLRGPEEKAPGRHGAGLAAGKAGCHGYPDTDAGST